MNKLKVQKRKKRFSYLNYSLNYFCSPNKKKRKGFGDVLPASAVKAKGECPCDFEFNALPVLIAEAVFVRVQCM